MSYTDVSLPGEIWKPVVGHETEHLVSSHGRVWSVRHAHLQHAWSAGGYPIVTVGGKGRAVHILVCEAFHGPRPPGNEAAHGDGDKGNARAENLRWATRAENERDKRLHGTAPIGERHPGARLTDADVAAIRSRYRAGESYGQIAKSLGVASATAREAGQGITFAHLPDRCPRKGEEGHRPGWLGRDMAMSPAEKSSAGRKGNLITQRKRYGVG